MYQNNKGSIFRTLAVKMAPVKPDVKKTSWITIIAIILTVAGYLVYHYGYMVYREYEYYTYYDDVHGLQRSSPVVVNGVRVGEVSDIYINGNDKVRVSLSIKKEIPVPHGSIALLASKGVLGEKQILLQPGNGPGIHEHNEAITGVYDTSVMDMKDQVAPMIESAKYILGMADKNFTNFNQRIANGLVQETQQNILSIEKSMNSYEKQVSGIRVSADKITKSVNDFSRQTNNLVANTKELNNSIKNAETSTAKYANEPIASTVDTLRNTISEVRKKATYFESSSTAKNAFTNRKDYEKTVKSLQETDSSMRKLHNNPPGFSLIGGGK